ncbi:hypothetical protein EV424DRAFT_1350177 [Suillus variegatus]|nr:hypothetical protein EV424DRAFT_1350177 [Suillus variegatus]
MLKGISLVQRRLDAEGPINATIQQRATSHSSRESQNFLSRRTLTLTKRQRGWMSRKQTLAECLAILKETKDVFVSLVKSPTEFAQGVLKKLLATTSIPDDAAETRTTQKCDITVIQDAINSIEDLHCEVHRGLDAILEMCGVCDEWKAGNDICQSMSMSGISEVAITYELGELMYQRNDC